MAWDVTMWRSRGLDKSNGGNLSGSGRKKRRGSEYRWLYVGLAMKETISLGMTTWQLRIITPGRL